MNRKSFLKIFSLSALVAVFMPKFLLSEKKETKPYLVSSGSKEIKSFPFVFFIDCSLQHPSHIYHIMDAYGEMPNYNVNKEIYLIRIETIKGNYSCFNLFKIKNEIIIPGYPSNISQAAPDKLSDTQVVLKIDNCKDITFPEFKDGIIKVILYSKPISSQVELYSPGINI